MTDRMFAAVVVLVLAVVGAAALYPAAGGTGSSTTSLTSSTTSTTYTECTTTSATQSAVVLNGTFTYSPRLPVVVDSVKAMIYTDASGNRTLIFSVAFTNDGTSPIYVPGGCGGALASAVVTGDGVIQKVAGAAFCMCPQFIREVAPGAGAVSTGPGCWSGYSYRVVGSGAFVADLTLKWSGPAGNSTEPTSATIVATFHM
jgi:hypothetical protein